MTEHIDIIASPSSGHQSEHAKALACGLALHGITSKIVAGFNSAKSPLVAGWGWRGLRSLHENGRDCLVMERGYIGDRFAWTSLAFNGLNGYGRFAITPDDGGERLDKYHPGIVKPWNPDGEYVLIIGQVPGDASLRGRDLQPWYEMVAKRCVSRKQRVLFRPHPNELRKGVRRSVIGAELSVRSLQEDLAGAYLVVTWNSNTAVDACLAGKPIVVSDPGSMAGLMARENTLDRFETSEPPKRRQWASALAWAQWSLDEMRDGTALAGLLAIRKPEQSLAAAITSGLTSG